METIRLPYITTSRALFTAAGKPRFGWVHSEFEIENIDYSDVSLAACHVLSPNGSISYYGHDGAFWISAINRRRPTAFNNRGLVAETVLSTSDPLNELWLQGLSLFQFPKMLARSREHGYSGLLHRETGSFRTKLILNSGDGEEEDRTDFQTWCRANLRYCDGRLLVKAHTPSVVQSWTIIDSPPNDDCRPIKFVQAARQIDSLRFSPGLHFSPEDPDGEETWRELGLKFGWPTSCCDWFHEEKYLNEAKKTVYEAGLWEKMKFNDMLVYNPEVMENVNNHPPEDLSERSAMSIADVLFSKTNTKDMLASQKRIDIEAFQAIRIMRASDRPDDTFEIIERLLVGETEKNLAARKWFAKETIRRLADRAISIDPANSTTVSKLR